MPLKTYKKRRLLTGSYDLYIINACNLHCKGCSVLDYKGRVTIGHMTVQDIVSILDRLDEMGVTLEELKILGGEPTLHKEFVEIVGTLIAYKGRVFNKLTLVTNGLALKPHVVGVLSNFDSVIVSVYPEMHVDRDITESPNGKDLLKLSNFEFWPQNTFEVYGEKGYFSKNTTAQENWDACWQKSNCQTLTKDGLFHCTITMNENTERQDYTTAEDMMKFVNRSEPLDFCAKCPWPPKMQNWESLKPTVDKKNYAKGVELINTIEVTDDDKNNNTNRDDDYHYGKRIRY